MANSGSRRPATTRPKGAAPALVGGGDRWFLHNLSLDLVSSLAILFVFSGLSDGTLPLLQLQLRPWRAIPRGRLAVPTPPGRAIPDRDARRFKEERDATRHELEIISKQAGIAELEWEH
jgi:hypothetical protein